MQCGFGGAAELLRCNEAPIGGWISRRFDEKSGIATAVWRGKIHGRTEIETVIELTLPATAAGNRDHQVAGELANI